MKQGTPSPCYDNLNHDEIAVKFGRLCSQRLSQEIRMLVFPSFSRVPE